VIWALRREAEDELVSVRTELPPNVRRMG